MFFFGMVVEYSHGGSIIRIIECFYLGLLNARSRFFDFDFSLNQLLNTADSQ
jgi:hypothetical protein